MFLLDQDDHLYRLPNATFERMLQDPGDHPIVRFAGARVRMVDMLIELLDRKPICVIWTSFGILTFNTDGCFDPNTFDRHQRARAEHALAPMAVEIGAPMTFVDATTHFVAQGGRWTPSGALARRIVDVALERATYTRLAVSRPRHTPSSR
ncbi:MAG: hypothetical protein WCA45_06450 [Thiobacillaceae bacterium]